MADIVTGNEFLRMQNDAVNRVKQMQRRADSLVGTPSPPSGLPHMGEPHRAPPPQGNRPEPFDLHQNVHSMPAGREHHGEPLQQNDGVNNPISGITGILESLFGGESDKLLVLGLIWLLSKEKADQMLIMALFYILM